MTTKATCSSIAWRMRLSKASRVADRMRSAADPSCRVSPMSGLSIWTSAVWIKRKDVTYRPLCIRSPFEVSPLYSATNELYALRFESPKTTTADLRRAAQIKRQGPAKSSEYARQSRVCPPKQSAENHRRFPNSPESPHPRRRTEGA